jgi:hypothetical protein
VTTVARALNGTASSACFDPLYYEETLISDHIAYILRTPYTYLTSSRLIRQLYVLKTQII